MENIVGLLLLATLVESFSEYVFGKIEKVKPFIMYIALALGVGVAFAYKLDILAMFSLHTNPYVAYVISGLIVGRGSNYLNDIISAIRQDNQPTTLVNPVLNQPNIEVKEPV